MRDHGRVSPVSIRHPRRPVRVAGRFRTEHRRSGMAGPRRDPTGQRHRDCSRLEIPDEPRPHPGRPGDRTVQAGRRTAQPRHRTDGRSVARSRHRDHRGNHRPRRRLAGRARPRCPDRPSSTAGWPARSCGSCRRSRPPQRARSPLTATRPPGGGRCPPCSTRCGLSGAAIDGDALPFTLHGTGALTGGTVSIDASASSQFVSGLLLSAASFTDGVRVEHRGGPLPSLPHIEMTVAALRAVGVGSTPTSRTPGGSRRGRSARGRRPSSRTCPTRPRSWPRRRSPAGSSPSRTGRPRTTQAGDAIRGILARWAPPSTGRKRSDGAPAPTACCRSTSTCTTSAS